MAKEKGLDEYAVSSGCETLEMNRLGLPQRIELDGALELLRCPDFRIGWQADSIQVVYDPNVWELPSQHLERARAWELANPNERSDPKVALRELRIDAEQRLYCQLQATEWRQVRPLHQGPALRESELIRYLEDGCSLLLPNIGVVHVVASTRDQWLLSYRRSEQVHYHPAAWSSTYEEGLAPEDIVGDTVFQRAARRGLLEEVTGEWESVGLEAFQLVSFIWERPLGNLAAVVVADLPISKEELPTHLPSNELEAGSVLITPIDRLRETLTDLSPLGVPSKNPWHPTSRYRLLAAIAHFFGEEAAAETLQKIVTQSHRA